MSSLSCPLKSDRVRLVQCRSPIGRHRSQRATLIALGLNKIGRSVVLQNTSENRGMIEKVAHLLDVGYVSGGR